VEVDVYGVADGYLHGVAQDLAGGVCGYGVAAFQDAEGTALFQLEAEAVQALAFCTEHAFGSSGQVTAALFQAKAQRGNLHTKIERDYAHVRGGEAAARMVNIGAEAVGQARGELVGALALLAQQV
jgi:hypothetical protein